MDKGLCSSIRAIGNLGTHEEALSDHILMYVDFDERDLFSGLINRPVSQHSREFTLEQADKVKAMLEDVIRIMEESKLGERVKGIARTLAREGPTHQAVRKYNSLYREAVEYVKGSNARIGRKSMATCDQTT